MANEINAADAAKGAAKAAGGFLKEFKEFALKGNVMDMAVGVIIGAAFGNIVTALTDDFINPLISLATGGVKYDADGNPHDCRWCVQNQWCIFQLWCIHFICAELPDYCIYPVPAHQGNEYRNGTRQEEGRRRGCCCTSARTHQGRTAFDGNS